MKNRIYFIFFTIFRSDWLSLLHFPYRLSYGDNDDDENDACILLLLRRYGFFFCFLIVATWFCCCYCWKHMKTSILQYFSCHYSWWFTNKGSNAERLSMVYKENSKKLNWSEIEVDMDWKNKQFFILIFSIKKTF